MKAFSVFAFILAVLALLFTLLTQFTNMGDGSTTYPLNAFFKNTGGVMEGNPVRMVGKVIGQVSGIELDATKRGVKMILNINESIKIPKDSYLKIAEKGMLGEMYLSFSFGESTEFYQSGEVVEGSPPKGLMDFMGSAEGSFKDGIESFRGAAEELKKLLANFNDVLEKDDMKTDLTKTVKALPDAIKEVTTLFKENKEVMKGILEKVNVLAGDGNSAVKNINEVLAELKETNVVKDLAGTLENTKKLTGELNSTLNEGELVKGLTDTISVYQSLGEKLTVSANQLEPLLASFGADHEGTLAKLLHDPVLHEKIKHFLIAGTALVTLLEEQPNSIIWGKKKRKTSTK